MREEEFQRAYKLTCDELDHGNPIYGARLLDLLREEIVSRGLPVPGVAA